MFGESRLMATVGAAELVERITGLLDRHGQVVVFLVASLIGISPGFYSSARADSLSPSDLSLYREAFHFAAIEHWGEAVATAAQAQERLPAKVIRWMDLARPKSGHGFAEIAAFLRANPTWPNQTGLQREAEATMPDGIPALEVASWFETWPPVSALGTGRYADALAALGEADRAAALVRDFWTKANFLTPEDEIAFRRRFVALLRPEDQLARLDRLLWEHQTAAAERLMPLVDAGHRAAADARLALAGDESGIDARLRQVPDALEGDPALVYERLHWRRVKGNFAGALEILRHPPSTLGRPALWWTERNFLARHLLEHHDAAGAYALVLGHGQTGGPALAEAEFLAGWLALRRLDRPAEALAHFHRLFDAVTTPMSRARGAYWCGRAADALGDAAQAQAWYAKAAAFPTMFYGQLATSALKPPRPLTIPAEPVVSREEAARFERRGMVQVVRLLHEIDPHDRGEHVGQFLRRLAAEPLTPPEWALLGRLAVEVRQFDEAIFIAKQALQSGVVLGTSGYPTVALHRNGGIEPALALSVIRQESTFNNRIVSSAGARGIMQLMPKTAARLARKLKLRLRITDALLTEDNEINILLGTAEIRELFDAYRGSAILALAGYNAGSGNIDHWLVEAGDPRNRRTDPIDWIESIPFAETRNYVQRILESLQVYRARLGQTSRTLQQDLTPP